MNKYKKAFKDLNHFMFLNEAGQEDYEEEIKNTLAIIKELIEKETPKKVIRWASADKCPNCDSFEIIDWDNNTECKRCSDCGQVLDWTQDGK